MPVSSHILSDISLGFCAIIFYANKGHFYLSQFPALFFFFFNLFRSWPITLAPISTTKRLEMRRQAFLTAVETFLEFRV